MVIKEPYIGNIYIVFPNEFIKQLCYTAISSNLVTLNDEDMIRIVEKTLIDEGAKTVSRYDHVSGIFTIRNDILEPIRKVLLDATTLIGQSVLNIINITANRNVRIDVDAFYRKGDSKGDICITLTEEDLKGW